MKPLEKLVVTQSFGANPAYYGQFGLRGHEGTDFRTKNLGTSQGFWGNLMGWQKIYAVASGDCTARYNHPQYGTYIDLVSNGNLYRYAHLKNVRPPDGMVVKVMNNVLQFKAKEGDVIGITGNSGNSSAPHLHFSYRPANFNINNGYFGFEDPMILFNQPTTIKIARIGQNLPPFSELQAQVDYFTKGKLKIECKDYDLSLYSLSMFTQNDAYNWLNDHFVDETFVQFYYSSPNAPFATSYSFPNLKKQISTLPNNPPAQTIFYELSNCLWNYANDELHAGLGYQPDSNFPDEAFIQSKVDKWLPFLIGKGII